MTDKPDRPHDTFFKNTFSDVANAAAELRAVLPGEVVELLRWDTMRLESGNFEVAKDRNRFCDLLFSVERNDGVGEVLVYVLFEHQSTDDPTMPLRMLRYMVRIWDLWLEDSDGQGLPLPPILPVVLSHDERGWRSARRFGELFEADEVNLAVMRRFVPDFELVVDDIARVTDDELLARALPPATALSVWALRDGRSPEALLAHAPFWARVVAALDRVPGGAQAMLRIMEYLGEAAGERSIDLEQLAAKIAESAPDGKDVTMNSLERLLEKGRLQGAATARLETRHKTLLKQLRLRFGELREEDLATIEAADEATLERYLERFATADSVAAVLGG